MTSCLAPIPYLTPRPPILTQESLFFHLVSKRSHVAESLASLAVHFPRMQFKV